MTYISARHFQAKAATLALCITAEPDPRSDDALEALGVDPELAQSVAGPIICTDIDVYDDGSFMPNYFGCKGFVFPIYDQDGETELDLCGFYCRHPGSFGTLLGQASIIGTANVQPGQPVRAWRHPLNWMRHGCSGIVILKPIAAAPALARCRLIPEDQNHARHLIRTGAAGADRLVGPSTQEEAA